MNQIEPIDRIGYILLVFSSFFVDDGSPYFVSYYSFCNHGLFLSFQDWRYPFVSRSRLGNILSSLYFFEELERFHSTAMWCSVLHLMDAGDSGRNIVISLFLTICSSYFVIRVPLWAIWAGGSLYLIQTGHRIFSSHRACLTRHREPGPNWTYLSSDVVWLPHYGCCNSYS